MLIIHWQLNALVEEIKSVILENPVPYIISQWRTMHVMFRAKKLANRTIVHRTRMGNQIKIFDSGPSNSSDEFYRRSLSVLPMNCFIN